MAESKTEKKEQEEMPATERQLDLIMQLQDEVGESQPETREHAGLRSRKQASSRIHYLKEKKVRETALRSANNNVPSFDKISHAMLFKLVWTEEDRRYFSHCSKIYGFVGAMTELYDTFKKSEAGVRKHVKESGQK